MKIEYSEAEIRQIMVDHTIELLGGGDARTMECEISVTDRYGYPVANDRWVKLRIVLPEQV